MKYLKVCTIAQRFESGTFRIRNRNDSRHIFLYISVVCIGTADHFSNLAIFELHIIRLTKLHISLLLWNVPNTDIHITAPSPYTTGWQCRGFCGILSIRCFVGFICVGDRAIRICTPTNSSQNKTQNAERSFKFILQIFGGPKRFKPETKRQLCRSIYNVKLLPDIFWLLFYCQVH